MQRLSNGTNPPTAYLFTLTQHISLIFEHEGSQTPGCETFAILVMFLIE